MIRVRFAPSPTGHLHIGSLRTALFNWLFARHEGGKFLVRIEDTDKERSLEVFTKSILASLAWCELEPDEPIVVQSKRIAEHQKAVEFLIEKGTAYKCYCSQEEIRERLRVTQQAAGDFGGYDGYCRERGLIVGEEVNPFVIRFKVPKEEALEFEDIVYGPISFNLREFDDFIIQRSDFTPTYNLVVVVDDNAMGITHVIRGEDHIPNTPKQILLYKALDYPIPFFAHIPLILSPEGRRLSKRDAATAVLDYQRDGFLADALCNYLVRLGWAYGDKEIFSRAEMIKFFDLNDVNKSGAAFDKQKLLWVNSVYLKEKKPEELLFLIERDINPEIKNVFSNWSSATLLEAILLYQSRVNTLKELVDELLILYNGPDAINGEVLTGGNSIIRGLLPELLVTLTNIPPERWKIDEIKKVIKEFCHKHEIRLSDIAPMLRLSILGKKSAPGIFEVLSLVGQKEAIIRFERFLQII